MGCLKTAIMSGAAIYGVKQLAKASEGRRSQQSPPQPYQHQDVRRSIPYDRDLYSYDYASDEECYERRPQTPRNLQRRMISDQPTYYEDADFGRGYVRQQQQRRPQGPYDSRGLGAEYYSPSPQGRAQHQYAENPPEYYDVPQRRQQEFVQSYEKEEPAQPSSFSNGARKALLGQAVQYAQIYGSNLAAGKANKRDSDG